MGISSDGTLCFGVSISDDEYGYDDFEWYNDKYDGDIEEWWADTHGDSPIPVQEVWHCSLDYPMFILAVPGKVFSASRGYPERIDLSKLTVSPEEIQALEKLCEEYDIEGKMGWWLTSYLG